jgi:hypothetical protein
VRHHTTKIVEEMLECLLASQEAVKTCHEEMMAQLGSLATQMDVFKETSDKMNQEKMWRPEQKLARNQGKPKLRLAWKK